MPPQVFIGQLDKVARGFEAGVASLREAYSKMPPEIRNCLDRLPPEWIALWRKIDVGDAAAIHFASVANQSRFVLARDGLAKATTAETARPMLAELEQVLKAEMDLARRLHAIQCRDPRIGFEASNQYYYVPTDLIEKVLNCRDLLDRWLPAHRWKTGSN